MGKSTQTVLLIYVFIIVATWEALFVTAPRAQPSPSPGLLTPTTHAEAALYQKWFYLNINMCTKVQATTAHFVLANKILNTLLKEINKQMAISRVQRNGIQ